MAYYPSAALKLIPENATQPNIMPRAIILHSAAGRGSLYGFWLNSSSLECHFWISETGEVEQYVSTTVRADANYHANNFAISIETESSPSATEPWTDAQLESIIALCDWLCDTHAIPREQIATPTGSGIGWHIMFGTPGPWTPVAKSCPGPARIAQVTDVIIPALSTPKETPFMAALSENEQRQLARRVDAIYLALVEDPKAPKGNLLKRIRDGVARLEAKKAA